MYKHACVVVCAGTIGTLQFFALVFAQTLSHVTEELVLCCAL